MNRVPYLSANLAEEMYRSCKKHNSVSLDLSLSTHHHLLRVQFITSLKSSYAPLQLDQTENNIIIVTHTPNAQLHPTSMFF